MGSSYYGHFCECGNEKQIDQVGCDECRAIEDRRWKHTAKKTYKNHKVAKDTEGIIKMLKKGLTYAVILGKYKIRSEEVAKIAEENGMYPRIKDRTWKKNLY